MEMHTVSSAAADSDSLNCSLVESLVAQTAVLADKSLLLLLLLKKGLSNVNITTSVYSGLVSSVPSKTKRITLLKLWSSTNEKDVFPNPVQTDQRFPTSDLNTVKEPDAENNDAGEAEDDNDGDDDDEDEDNDEDDGNDSEEDSDDDEEDSDDELQAAGYGESDDDDDDDDDDEDDDSDEEDDSDEDEDEDDSDDEDDEEQYKLPSERKK